MKYVKFTYFLIAFFAVSVFTGCSSQQVLYENENSVTITLVGEPEVTDSNGYSIYFKFESPTTDSHLVQQIKMNPDSSNEWVGQEAFRVPFSMWQRDHHHTEGTSRQFREMTIMPGTVEGADETLGGFSMLPSDWPNTKTKDGEWTFNHNYRRNHEVRGNIVELRPEYGTRYHLNYDKKHLILIIEGGPTYVWDKTGLIYKSDD